jgi:hypothetical protein
LPAKRKPLGFKCPECGREYGSLRLKTFRQNRKKLIENKMQSVRVKRDDHGEVIRKIGINRNLHTLKYDTFIPILGIPDPNKRPILNLPLPMNHTLPR